MDDQITTETTTQKTLKKEIERSTLIFSDGQAVCELQRCGVNFGYRDMKRLRDNFGEIQEFSKGGKIIKARIMPQKDGLRGATNNVFDLEFGIYS